MDDKFLYNNKSFRDRRRELRNKPTPAEAFLWQYLSKNQIQGLRFHRQYGVGPYILDFFCTKVRLAIELDGDVHTTDDAKIYDKEREQFLRSANIHILRFWNDDLLNSVDNVVEQINQKVAALGKTKETPLR